MLAMAFQNVTTLTYNFSVIGIRWGTRPSRAWSFATVLLTAFIVLEAISDSRIRLLIHSLMTRAFGNSKDAHCKVELEQIVTESNNVGSNQIHMQHVA